MKIKTIASQLKTRFRDAESYATLLNTSIMDDINASPRSLKKLFNDVEQSMLDTSLTALKLRSLVSLEKTKLNYNRKTSDKKSATKTTDRKNSIGLIYKLFSLVKDVDFDLTLVNENKSIESGLRAKKYLSEIIDNCSQLNAHIDKVFKKDISYRKRGGSKVKTTRKTTVKEDVLKELEEVRGFFDLIENEVLKLNDFEKVSSGQRISNACNILKNKSVSIRKIVLSEMQEIRQERREKRQELGIKDNRGRKKLNK